MAAWVTWGLQMSAQPGLGGISPKRLKAALHTCLWAEGTTYEPPQPLTFASYRTASFGVCYAKFPSFPMGLSSS